MVGEIWMGLRPSFIMSASTQHAVVRCTYVRMYVLGRRLKSTLRTDIVTYAIYIYVWKILAGQAVLSAGM
jgi:hypothetical protein